MADPSLSKKDAFTLARHQSDRRFDLANRLGGMLIGRGLKWGFFAFLAYQARVALVAFSGKTTLASFLVAIGAQVSMVVAASWSVAVMFAVWVFLERRLRKGTTERLAMRIRDLEIQIDRHRSSSQLTSRGDTRPEDQL